MLCEKQREKAKIGAVDVTALHFGLEDLVKTKMFIIYGKKKMDKALHVFLKC
jgi:hypothetical protein